MCTSSAGALTVVALTERCLGRVLSSENISGDHARPDLYCIRPHCLRQTKVAANRSQESAEKEVHARYIEMTLTFIFLLKNHF